MKFLHCFQAVIQNTSWYEQLQNSEQSTFWNSWKFYTEGSSINDADILIKLEKNWRLRVFKICFLPQLDFGFLYMFCLPLIYTLIMNVAWQKDASGFYPIVGTIQMTSFSYYMFDVSLSLPCFCSALHWERWPMISLSLRLPLPTSLNFFHMTLSPVSLLKVCSVGIGFIFPNMGISCSEKHIKIIQIWHG